ncbi:hypothetical protein D477_013135 [Arthrobacter crystallopoietes BAB-32]|uniref:Uncharacterized protein n=1 Tax=Arthrobacter crystallopoietes BAB-32 TaxID=1246476 RepID=N1UTM3_9MICC|nr:hypothetical protein D477_013135 [Arthrobacter crystallopoietes BAB-32]
MAATSSARGSRRHAWHIGRARLWNSLGQLQQHSATLRGLCFGIEVRGPSPALPLMARSAAFMVQKFRQVFRTDAWRK